MGTYNTNKSKLLFERAKAGLVGGVASSLHKGAFQEYPIFIEQGKGSRIYDVDGNEYIDYMMAFGPMIHGYAPEFLNEAITRQLTKGTQFAAPTESLVQLTEKLVEIIPSAEKVSSYYNSGTEANIAAFRLARGYTGKTKIIKFEGHYHGWMDELKVSSEAPSPNEMGPRNKPWKLRHFAGQMEPDNIIVLPYNDIGLLQETIAREGHDIAGVILETVMCNAEPVLPQPGFLEALRELTAQHNIMLIFDEIITGFRLALGGAQEYFQVTPDISVFGKAIAGGYPLSAVVGREAVVASGAASLGTFNGNPLCVAAALATIEKLEVPGCYERLHNLSQTLMHGLQALSKQYGLKAYCKALGSIWIFILGTEEPLLDYRDHFAKVDKVTYRRICELGLKEGVRFNPFRGRGYISTAHTEADIAETLEKLERIFAQL